MREGSAMGLLQGLGVKAEARRLRPFMRADEHYLECDIVEVPVIARADGTRSPYGSAVVSLTSHAIYIRPNKGGAFEAIRVSYPEIINWSRRGPMVDVTTRHSQILFVTGRAAMIPDLYDSISMHMRRIEQYSERVDLPDGGFVHAVFRPMKEGGAASWVLFSSEGVDMHHAETRAVLEHALGPAISRLGPLP